jgi:hypothetical protein
MTYQDSQKALSDSDSEGVSQFITHQQEPLPVSRDVEANAALPEKKVSYMSLPNKRQLAILCIARLTDPLATTSIQVCLIFPSY